jgi:short-subunit dehydrogenase
MRLKPLNQQIIVITGASSGIGLVTARRAAAAGARVFLISRNGAALAAIVGEIVAAGGRAAFAVADVGDRDALEAAATTAMGQFGRIDTWVSCAGVAIYAPLLETPASEHERLFRTNYFGTVNSALAAVPRLQAAGGALISIGSVAGDMPSPMMGAYAASKHALRAFIASLRIELKAQGTPISVTLIKPSGVTTPIARHAANHQPGEARVPPPPYDPALVADAILHAATQPVRDLTVGGIGKLEVLFANLFPAAFARLAPAVVPFLSDPATPRTPGDNLAGPGEDGLERSPGAYGRKTSLSLAVRLHPITSAAALGAAAVVCAGLALTSRRRSVKPPRS